MKISPVNNVSNVSCQGRLSPKTCLMLGEVQVGLNNAFNSAINKDTKFVLSNSKLQMTNKLANIFDNLNIIMERFGHGCELTFEQSEKSQTQRFFIENKSSFYKMIIGDTHMPKTGCPKDIDDLEQIANKLETVNPYEANLKFTTCKKPQAEIRDFLPDEDYTILEDRLIKDS